MWSYYQFHLLTFIDLSLSLPPSLPPLLTPPSVSNQLSQNHSLTSHACYYLHAASHRGTYKYRTVACWVFEQVCKCLSNSKQRLYIFTGASPPQGKLYQRQLGVSAPPHGVFSENSRCHGNEGDLADKIFAVYVSELIGCLWQASCVHFRMYFNRQARPTTHTRSTCIY